MWQEESCPPTQLFPSPYPHTKQGPEFSGGTVFGHHPRPTCPPSPEGLTGVNSAPLGTTWACLEPYLLVTTQGGGCCYPQIVGGGQEAAKHVPGQGIPAKSGLVPNVSSSQSETLLPDSGRSLPTGVQPGGGPTLHQPP